MGLLGDWLGSKRMKDPVRGTAHVVSCTMAPDQATSGNVRLTLVVSADGVPSTPVEHHQIAPVTKWPQPGMTLPVTVDRSDPERMRVEFDELPEHRDVAWQEAQALAGGGVSHQTYTVSNLDELPPEIRQQLQGIGLDLRALADAHAAQADGDLTHQLAKLAELRASGALSEDEFAAAKRKLLG